MSALLHALNVVLVIFVAFAALFAAGIWHRNHSPEAIYCNEHGGAMDYRMGVCVLIVEKHR